ncbi:large conductance mechanosensitive channel protein MscL [Leucobacter chromiireducens]|uniref:Large-conductance mechanosensitive channel n=1 Tax=Leucobacter chromiireducens subsp. chromiireducens TaxID=660067 RepID=A0ABS1SPY4_9MICO|nr:large conductance mechanosensitive channel protein MscL [Leucobacter chromiireducens]MBL3690039.1 large conductance mechanosensitive channel protein MscL [Leucobacter chromiireducens subsp. chromiireducens]
MFKGFKEFLLRGNVVDLAVAVVIGAAFNAVVQKVVDSLINPIIGMVFKADSLDGALLVELPGGGSIAFGALIGAILNFLIVAAVVYFVFVMPMNKLRDMSKKDADEEVAAETEQELLVEIRDLLRAQATASGQVPAAPAAPEAPGAHRE